MAKQDKIFRSGFVIKLSNETAQKLAEEEQQAKTNAEKALVNSKEDVTNKGDDTKLEELIITKLAVDIQNSSVKVSPPDKSSENESSSVKIQSRVSKINQDASSDFKESTDYKSNPDSTTEKGSEKSTDAPMSVETTDASWGEYEPYITYEGEEAIYTDPSTKQRYTWSKDTNSWVAKESVTNRVYSYEDDKHVYTEADGSKSFWDDEKKAWLPKIDDDFLAIYQMSYGFVDNKPTETKEDEKPKDVQEKSGVKRKTDPQWFEPSQDKNTKVYVSNLPLDLTEEEFVNFMQKCGLVERDPRSQKMKVKLYMDKEQNCFKGDALCTYIKIESIDLALKLLDGSDLKGNKVKVEKAQFELKGEYNPALKPKKKKKKELEKIKKMQQQLFDWRPEKFIGERSKHERVVILKNMFHPTDFDKEVQLLLDYQQDLREEAAKSGEVRKVVLYDRHPEGVAQITMKEPEQADAVVVLMNGRWFGKRQITAEIWDGRTKYRIAETDADIGKRIDKWDKFLEDKDDEKKDSDENKTTDDKLDEKKHDSEKKLIASSISAAGSIENKPVEENTTSISVDIEANSSEAIVVEKVVSKEICDKKD